MRVVGIADADSYLKWGAAVLGELPGDWDKRLVILQTPVAPSESQAGAALAATAFRGKSIDILGLADIVELVARTRPEVVFLALRGPAVRVVIRSILKAGGRRPVFVSGMPGISFPATKRALLYRGQVDLMLVHSKREREAFGAMAARLELEQDFALATLAFLAPALSAPVAATPMADRGRDIIFATQAKVPRTRGDRLAILEWLAETARRHPDRRVVIKLRAVDGEKQTHAERYAFDALAAELAPLPANLVFAGGAMSDQLDVAAALVTVSSTAALESAARGIPTLVLDDFGVSKRLINLVFEESNLLGSSADLMAGRFFSADPGWLDANYFHPASDNDWLGRVVALVGRNALSGMAARPEARRHRGGALRRAWDRKQVLGPFDTSAIGRVSVVVGTPARATYLAFRRLRRRVTRAVRRIARRGGASRPTPSLEPSPRTRLTSSSSIDLPHAR